MSLQCRLTLHIGQTNVFERRILRQVHVVPKLAKPHEPGDGEIYEAASKALLDNQELLDGPGQYLRNILDLTIEKHNQWIEEGQPQLGRVPLAMPFLRLAAVIGLPAGTSKDCRKTVEGFIYDWAVKKFGGKVYYAKEAL